MDPLYDFSDEVTSLLRLMGLEEDREEFQDAMAEVIPLLAEGGDGQKGVQFGPEQGAAAAPEKEAGAEEGGHVGAAAPGSVDDGKRDDSGDSSQEREKQDLSTQAAIKAAKPGNKQQHFHCAMFTQAQMQELERVFKRNQYPEEAMRKDLARRMGVTEARVKGWFKNRRTRWRRRQRALRFSNVPPVAGGHPVILASAVPHPPMLIQDPLGGWVFLEPMPVGALLLPLPPPYPHAFLPPLPLLTLPLPPYGPPCDKVWLVVICSLFPAPLF